MSDQNKISFLSGRDEPLTPKGDSPKPHKSISQIAEEQKAKSLCSKDQGVSNSHSIFSAMTGAITDERGPSRYIKSESSNTLWDNDKINKIPIDNKMKTKEEKLSIADNKRHMEQSRMDALANALKSVDQSKSTSVFSTGSYQGGNYKSTASSMSLFDSSDFERLPDKTSGEKIKEDNLIRRSHKDDSWRGNSKSVTAKEVVSNFFDNLLGEKDK